MPPPPELNLPYLHQKYHGELKTLSKQIRAKSFDLHKAGHIVGFGDYEGEIAYAIIRETKPNLVYEISPAAGYSTNYILSALTKNQSGKLQSFELLDKIYGIPTKEVILGNLIPEADSSRIEVITGDVTSKKLSGTPNFLLLDSCHEAWFAEWYIQELIDRVQGWVMIQDIVFSDRIEKTGEASVVLDWLAKQSIDFMRVGVSEKEQISKSERLEIANRRPLESNSILFKHPFCFSKTNVSLDDKPEDFLDRALAVSSDDTQASEDLLIIAENMLSRNTLRSSRHRLFIKISRSYAVIGNPDMSLRCLHMALGDAMAKDGTTRAKALREIWKESKKQHWILRFLSSKKSRRNTKVICDGGFWFLALSCMLSDKLMNWKSWRRHT